MYRKSNGFCGIRRMKGVAMQYLVFFEFRNHFNGNGRWQRSATLHMSKTEAKREARVLADRPWVRDISVVMATGGWARQEVGAPPSP
jgi:hypothetical protein